jgi:hypothetical protein
MFLKLAREHNVTNDLELHTWLDVAGETICEGLIDRVSCDADLKPHTARNLS